MSKSTYLDDLGQHITHSNKTTEIKFFLTPHIVFAKPGDTLLKICKKMADANISCIVIKGSNGGKPGIITERDILKRVAAQGVDTRTVRAKDIMTKHVLSINEERDLTEAMVMMRDNKIRRLLVTSSGGKLKGIITQTDVTNALYRVLLEKVKEVKAVYFRTQRLFKDSVKALVKTLDAKDHYTGAHSRGVAKLVRFICRDMDIDDVKKRTIHLAALFHDIGKIHINDQVLNKNGPLDKSEYDQIKLHPIISEMILRPITEFKHALSIIRHHHEWYNGSGYPDGIKGEHIPLGARVIALADSYNAMRTHRPYRPAMKREDAIENIRKGIGTQFDPIVAKVFLKILKKNPSF